MGGQRRDGKPQSLTGTPWQLMMQPDAVKEAYQKRKAELEAQGVPEYEAWRKAVHEALDMPDAGLTSPAPTPHPPAIPGNKSPA